MNDSRRSVVIGGGSADIATEQWFERVGMAAKARTVLWDRPAPGIAARGWDSRRLVGHDGERRAEWALPVHASREGWDTMQRGL
ncbi:hypothetical protein HGA13_01520 [Nocardia speluncae]|uniref:Uncharacterized protein n=1 Tax=Nocardia speluncae TaxID=419477 RepID=A0A846XAT5_9NOCA|nr:hypothetical protein [Nocardia speluncae]NKY31756.1 hypothetical protein [Nocardia speluncae]